MNGTEFNESFALPREREKQKKILLNGKIFLGLLLSNAMTFLLCLPSEDANTIDKNIPRKGFQLIELPLKNFTRTSGIARATLFKGEEVVLHDVTIHHHLNGKTNPSLYLLEVPEKDLARLIQYKGLTLSAFPYGNYPFKKRTSRKGFSYEIRF